MFSSSQVPTHCHQSMLFYHPQKNIYQQHQRQCDLFSRAGFNHLENRCALGAFLCYESCLSFCQNFTCHIRLLLMFIECPGTRMLAHDIEFFRSRVCAEKIHLNGIWARLAPGVRVRPPAKIGYLTNQLGLVVLGFSF